MIGDDDFFMQNADYHYGASDEEKMYGRDYYDPSDYVGGYHPSSYTGYESGHNLYGNSYNGSQSSSARTKSNSNEKYTIPSENESLKKDSRGKYWIAGIIIALLAVVIVTGLVIHAVDNYVAIDDLKITRYVETVQYKSEIHTYNGYEITYNQTSYREHSANVSFYTKDGKVLYEDRFQRHELNELPYIVYFDGEADYAIFEVYRRHSGICIYRERVDVDNINVKRKFINYD